MESVAKSRVHELLEAVFVPSNVGCVQDDVVSSEQRSLEGAQSIGKLTLGIGLFHDHATEHEQRLLWVDDR